MTEYGEYGPVKTTLDIHEKLLIRAKRFSKQTGRPLRALVEEGLRRVLQEEKPVHYELPDRSVGHRGDPNPLEALSWQDLRGEIYGRSDHE